MTIIRSPVSGTVIAVSVLAGQRIGRDDDLILVESMKMEIGVAAEAEGIVKRLLVAKGDVVQEGDPVAELG